MSQMDPETSKNQTGMLKTFEINDSKPNWQKKIFLPKMYNSPLSVVLKKRPIGIVKDLIALTQAIAI